MVKWREVYGTSLALLVDQYELTMAYGYWKRGMADQPAVFSQFYRTQPFGSGYAILAGLEPCIEFLETLRFEPSDLDYLSTLRNAADAPLFEEAFLDYLSRFAFTCDVDAIPEGTAVFPQEPLIRVCGPLLQAQIIETSVLNLINFQTLIATKAARICQAAQADTVIEFGLRRAHGVDGGLSATRAAFVGGCQETSNLLAGKLFGIPPRGTHAHSWVMAFDSQQEAFEAWAEVMPDNSVLLVDTYDTLQGVREAAEVGLLLRVRGKRLMGVRLDSGDLLELGAASRRILDEKGLTEVKIVASSELDEYCIAELKSHHTPISVWGVGTRLVTGHGKGALGGVYKLTAIKSGGIWSPRMKRSGEGKKATLPGFLQVRRQMEPGGQFVGDVIYEEGLGIDLAGEDLLQPVLRGGERVRELPSLKQIQQRTRQQLGALPDAVLRLKEPECYPVSIEARLDDLQKEILDVLSDFGRHSK